MATKNRSAVVIEDISAQREDYGRLLSRYGYEVEKIADFQELERVLREKRKYDLAIVDHRLWEGTAGSEIAKELKDRSIARKVVVVTGYPQDFSSKDLEDRGIFVREKPADISDLLEESNYPEPKSPRRDPNSQTRVQRAVKPDQDSGTHTAHSEKTRMLLIRVPCFAFTLVALLLFVDHISAMKELTFLKMVFVVILLAFALFGLLGAIQPGPLERQLKRFWGFMK